MPTLIGDGGHARDIWATIGNKAAWERVAHHSHLPAGTQEFIIGVNDAKHRAHIAAELRLQDRSWCHPNAYIGTEVVWGPGTHINYGVTMTRTTIGRHTTIAPGVTICGDVTIGNRCFIGAGAVIVNLTTVPDDTFVKAGTVWTGR